jgi:hypothetical protein
MRTPKRSEETWRTGIAFGWSPRGKFRRLIGTGLQFHNDRIRFEHNESMPGSCRDLYDRHFCAHLQSANDLTLRSKREQNTASLYQDEHFPLQRMLVRTYVSPRLHKDHQALNLVTMASVQEQMNSLSFTLDGVACHLTDDCAIDTVDVVAVSHNRVPNLDQIARLY